MLCWTVYAFGKVDILGVDLSWSLEELKDQAHLISKSLGHYVGGHEYRGTEDTQYMLDHFIRHDLGHHLIEISQILFFLLGAMTVVELIDAHEGFAVVTDKITTTNKVKLIWILAILTFFFLRCFR